jgi:hypothetical protein
MRFYDLGATIAITAIVISVGAGVAVFYVQGQNKKLEDHLKNQPTFCATAEGYGLGRCEESNTAAARSALYNFYNTLQSGNFTLSPEEPLPDNPFPKHLETLKMALENLEKTEAFDETAAQQEINARIKDIVAKERQGTAADEKLYEELETKSKAFHAGKTRNDERQRKIKDLKAQARSWRYPRGFDPESRDDQNALETWLEEQEKTYQEQVLAPLARKNAARQAIQTASNTAKSWPPYALPQSQIAFSKNCRVQEYNEEDLYSGSTPIPVPCDEKALSPRDQQRLEKIEQELTKKLFAEDRAVMQALSTLKNSNTTTLAETVQKEWLEPLADAKNAPSLKSFYDFVNAFRRN